MIIVRRIFLVVVLALLALSLSAGAMAQEPGVNVLTISGTINPVLIDYVERGIRQAEDSRAEAVIIQIDTPGGLDSSMREIIQAIVNSRVPVVVYVAPSGARAASAGLYILMSSHVAAMGQNTVTGAATPVAMGDDGGEAGMSDEMKAKVINDAAAYMRSLAESHNRNVDWAERAVREGVSVTEQEALELGVIEIVAPDLDSLLAQLHGREITLVHGQTVTINTEGVPVNNVPMRTLESFLYAITDPNIAYLLLSLATLGIMAEIFNPGLIFPGVLGGISLLLAFYSLGMLPVNYAGILLIVLAIGLFVAEVFTTTFGIFTAGGIVSLVFGSMILFQGASPVFRVDPTLIAGVTIIISGTLAFMVQRTVKAHRKQPRTGREELSGKTAVTRTALTPGGLVFYKGERWNAVSESGEIKIGEEVVINRVDGLVLYVAKKSS